MQPPRHIMAERLSALDGLRGVAALLVAIFHFRHFSPWFHTPWLGGSGFLPSAYLWVDLFFVLSGFVLAHVYADAFRRAAPSWGQVRDFWWARFARVYPLHLASLLLVVALVGAGWVQPGNPADGHCYGAGNLVASLTLTHSWNTTDGLCWNVPSWSISAEAAAYLLFPWLALIVMRLPRRWMPLVPVACFAALLFLAQAKGGGALSLHYEWGWARCLASFTLGIWIYREKSELALWQRAAAGDLALLVLGLTLLAAMHLMLHDVLIVAIMALIVAGMAGNRGYMAILFGTGVLAWLGAISYAIYMLHWPLLLIFVAVLEAVVPVAEMRTGSAFQLTVKAIYMMVLLAVSSACYRYLEQPARHWLRQYGPGWRSRQRIVRA